MDQLQSVSIAKCAHPINTHVLHGGWGTLGERMSRHEGKLNPWSLNHITHS